MFYLNNQSYKLITLMEEATKEEKENVLKKNWNKVKEKSKEAWNDTKDFNSNLGKEILHDIKGTYNLGKDFLADRASSNINSIKDFQTKKAARDIDKKIKEANKKIKDLEIELRTPEIMNDPEKLRYKKDEIKKYKKDLKTFDKSKKSFISYDYKNEFKNKAGNRLSHLTRPFVEHPVGATLTGLGVLGLGTGIDAAYNSFENPNEIDPNEIDPNVIPDVSDTSFTSIF